MIVQNMGKINLYKPKTPTSTIRAPFGMPETIVQRTRIQDSFTPIPLTHHFAADAHHGISVPECRRLILLLRLAGGQLLGVFVDQGFASHGGLRGSLLSVEHSVVPRWSTHIVLIDTL
jgi:hypothetical protein